MADFQLIGDVQIPASSVQRAVAGIQAELSKITDTVLDIRGRIIDVDDGALDERFQVDVVGNVRQLVWKGRDGSSERGAQEVTGYIRELKPGSGLDTDIDVTGIIEKLIPSDNLRPISVEAIIDRYREGKQPDEPDVTAVIVRFRTKDEPPPIDIPLGLIKRVRLADDAPPVDIEDAYIKRIRLADDAPNVDIDDAYVKRIILADDAPNVDIDRAYVKSIKTPADVEIDANARVRKIISDGDLDLSGNVRASGLESSGGGGFEIPELGVAGAITGATLAIAGGIVGAAAGGIGLATRGFDLERSEFQSAQILRSRGVDQSGIDAIFDDLFANVAGTATGRQELAGAFQLALQTNESPTEAVSSAVGGAQLAQVSQLEIIEATRAQEALSESVGTDREARDLLLVASQNIGDSLDNFLDEFIEAQKIGSLAGIDPAQTASIFAVASRGFTDTTGAQSVIALMEEFFEANSELVQNIREAGGIVEQRYEQGDIVGVLQELVASADSEAELADVLGSPEGLKAFESIFQNQDQFDTILEAFNERDNSFNEALAEWNATNVFAWNQVTTQLGDIVDRVGETAATIVGVGIRDAPGTLAEGFEEGGRTGLLEGVIGGIVNPSGTDYEGFLNQSAFAPLGESGDPEPFFGLQGTEHGFEPSGLSENVAMLEESVAKASSTIDPLTGELDTATSAVSSFASAVAAAVRSIERQARSANTSGGSYNPIDVAARDRVATDYNAGIGVAGY